LEIQTYASELSPAEAWKKLYSDRDVDLRFPFEGKELRANDIIEIFTADPDQNRRAAAHKVFEDVYAKDAWLNTKIHNELIRLKKVGDKWQNFDGPAESRHFSNNVPSGVVDALESAVKDSYSRTSHRFYALKAKLMGQDHLNIYDRNINVLEAGGSEKISWDEARRIVLDAYNSFSPEIGAIAQKFFDEGWIDAAPGDHKADGAFSSSGPAQLLNPLVMMNYKGTARDVATLAHELGHGVHQYLAAHKGDALVHTPLTLAETASIFGEMATYKSLLERTDNEDERRKLLFDKVNDMINSVMRQISFYDFEKRNHTQYRESGPLSAEDYGKNWVGALQDSYGEALPLDESYGPVFGYIPHIVSTPFYVYAYAFGDSFVNALYQVYEEGTMPKEEFVDRYTKMLEAGGTYTLEDVKKDYGLDINDPAFWQKGLSMIEGMIDELEVLCQPLLDAKNQPAAQTAAPDIGQP
jgi:oligoendopeptidase F